MDPLNSNQTVVTQYNPNVIDVNYKEALLEKIVKDIFGETKALRVLNFATQFTSKFPLENSVIKDLLKTESEFLYNGSLYNELIARIFRPLGSEDESERLPYVEGKCRAVEVQDVKKLLDHCAPFTSLDHLIYKILTVAKLPGFIGLREDTFTPYLVKDGEFITQFSREPGCVTIVYTASKQLKKYRIESKSEKSHDSVQQSVQNAMQRFKLDKPSSKKFETSFQFLEHIQDEKMKELNEFFSNKA